MHDMHGVRHPLHPADLVALLDLIHHRMAGTVPPPRDNGIGQGPALPPGQFMLPGPNDSPNFPPPIYDDLLVRGKKPKLRLGSKFHPNPYDVQEKRLKNA